MIHAPIARRLGSWLFLHFINGGLKAAGDLAKAFLQLKSDAERQAKVIELQSIILAAQSNAIAAQSDQFAMLEEVRALKEEIAQVKAWETEKQRYQMVSPFSGATVYALKEAMSNGEPPHYICANCYQNGKRSILQCKTPTYKDGDGTAKLVCRNLSCKSESVTAYVNCVAAEYAEKVVTC